MSGNLAGQRRVLFRAKACGITREADAIAAIDAGFDAIGLNFHRPSPRHVTFAQAERIVRSVRGRLKCVGVFVDEAGATMRRLTSELGLDVIQLHGSESAEVLLELVGIEVVRAIRLAGDIRSETWDTWMGEDIRNRLAAVLVDSFVPGRMGGTGSILDMDVARNAKAAAGGVPLVLAGGLNAANVAAAILEIGPDGVDVASGIESSPGIKDHGAMAEFMAEAQRGFALLAERS